MDAHVFRRVAIKLAGLLKFARIEKIFRPAKDILVFALYAGQSKHFLVFRYGRRNQALFLSSVKPQAPTVPDSEVMFFRKYFNGRRIASVVFDWPKRQLVFYFMNRADLVAEQYSSHSCGATADKREYVFSHRDINPGFALLLDLREGARALTEIPSDFVKPVVWPGYTGDACTFGEAERIWEHFPVITPLLRKTLVALEPLEARALLSDLESEADGQAGEGETWVYEPEKADCTEKIISAWPLPEVLCAGLKVRAFEDVLEAAEYAGVVSVFTHASTERDKPAALAQSRELKRLKQVLTKLEFEEKRLNEFLTRKEDGLLLQAHLYLFEADEHRDSVDIPSYDADGSMHRVALEPRLTVRENMLRMFQMAAKAARGFEHVERRRREVEDAIAALCSHRECLEASGDISFGARQKKGSCSKGVALSGTGKNTSAGNQVSSFISSDGFLLLRGRSAKGNREVLKMAAPYDYWLHCEDGPSAHLIVRRKHAAQIVPERTMQEAACLVAVKSWRKQDSSARIMYTLARDVQPIKGGPDGKVKVTRQIGVFVVAPDLEIETRLERGLI